MGATAGRAWGSLLAGSEERVLRHTPGPVTCGQASSPLTVRPHGHCVALPGDAQWPPCQASLTGPCLLGALLCPRARVATMGLDSGPHPALWPLRVLGRSESTAGRALVCSLPWLLPRRPLWPLSTPRVMPGRRAWPGKPDRGGIPEERSKAQPRRRRVCLPFPAEEACTHSPATTLALRGTSRPGVHVPRQSHSSSCSSRE